MALASLTHSSTLSGIYLAMNSPSPAPERRDRLGPGIITGIADDDPSGIATYSQAGAQFGLSLSWTLLATFPLMAAIQIASARIGRITGKGLIDNFQQRLPTWFVALLVLLLSVANGINIGANLRAMGDVTAIATGIGSIPIWVTVYGLGSLLLLVWVPYKRYVKVLQWLTLSILAYLAVALSIDVNWYEAILALVTPMWLSHPDFLTTVVAILGTSISPYLFFWQASQEVEEIERLPEKEPLCHAPRQAGKSLRDIRIDTWIGMGVSNVIAFFIIVAAAATLNAQGIHHIESTVQAAQALAPFAGRFAFWLFGMGIVGTGLLALPVLATTVGYGVASLMNWTQGLHRRPREAPHFYGALCITMLLGMVLAIVPINPMAALYWSAVINAVIAVPIMVAVLMLASSPSAMKGFVLPPILRCLGWMATLAMAGASALMFFNLAFGGRS